MEHIRQNILKSFGISDIEKGVYFDNAENRKLGRVGQKFGGKKEENTNSLLNLKLKDLEKKIGVFEKQDVRGYSEYKKSKESLEKHDKDMQGGKIKGFSRETLKKQNDIKVVRVSQAFKEYKKNLIQYIQSK